MAGLSKFRFGLAAKLAVSVIAGATAFFGLFGFLNLKTERRQAEDLIEQSARRVADVIVRSIHYEMLKNDQPALHNRIDEMGAEPGIQKIRLFNKEGVITYSTDAREIGRHVDKTAEQCYPCHSGQKPRAELKPADRSRRFPDAQGRPILGVMQPINNAPECSNSECHVHQAGLKVLGVIDADLS